ncbi:MAG: hypothetical protein ACI4WW_02665 [Candidatus Coprovivens sp.]
MKEKYMIYKEYVVDKGLGIECTCDNDFIDVLDNLEEAKKEFNSYLSINASERYTQDNHPLNKKFTELNLVKVISFDDEDWENEDYIEVVYYE